MKLLFPHKLNDIAAIINCKYEGNPEHIVTGLNEIHIVEQGDIVFVDHPKYYEKAISSKATTILINPPEDRQGKNVVCPKGKAFLISDNPFRDYNKLVRHFQPLSYSLESVSSTAKVGINTVIMPGVYLGSNVTIGDNCVLHPNVVVYDNCHIKNNVIIHANTVIGADAFYYKKRKDKHDKMISCGRVIIENNVEIGAMSTIDKGVSGDTIIGEGTKIDNHVQIGHDTVVGKMCLMAAHVGVSGCVVIKDGATLWGQAGVRSDVIIGQGSVLLAQSGLTENLPDGKTFFGTPAGEARSKMKEVAALKMLPDLIKKI
jgi:UDP-3-O-[3-hydroxymyristoyl] glucosamine N-acyltransferase